MLEFVGVEYGWSPQAPLQHDLSLRLRPGSFITVLGGNGCGKSSLFSVFSDRSMLLGGRILIEGVDMTAMTPRQLFSRMAVVAQNVAAVYPYSVLEYVLTGWFPWLGMFRTPGPQQRRDAQEVMERLGIASWSEHPVTALSGGEFKLAQLARAMTGGRRLLLLDEVDAALDFSNQVRLADLLRDFAASGGAVMLITHNPNLPLALKSEVLLLSKTLPWRLGPAGELVVPGTLEEYFGVRVGEIRDRQSGLRQVIPLSDPSLAPSGK